MGREMSKVELGEDKKNEAQTLCQPRCCMNMYVRRSNVIADQDGVRKSACVHMPFSFKCHTALTFYHKITATPPYSGKFVYLYKFAEWAFSFLTQKVPKELGIMEKNQNSFIKFLNV